MEGKCKEKFEEWYLDECVNISKAPIDIRNIELDRFYENMPCEQWGVIQDFADSVGYYLEVFSDDVLDLPYGSQISISENIIWWGKVFKTRQETRTAAIEKLNQLINKE